MSVHVLGYKHLEGASSGDGGVCRGKTGKEDIAENKTCHSDFHSRVICAVLPSSHFLPKPSTNPNQRQAEPEAFAFTFNPRKRKNPSVRKLKNWMAEGGDRGRALGLGLNMDSGW